MTFKSALHFQWIFSIVQKKRYISFPLESPKNCAPHWTSKMHEKHLKNNDYGFLDKIWPNWNDFKPLTLTKWHLTQRNILLSKLWHGSFVMAHIFFFFCTQALLFCAPFWCLWIEVTIHCCSFVSNVFCACEFLSVIFLLRWADAIFVVKHFKWFFFFIFWPLLNDLHKYPFSHTNTLTRTHMCDHCFWYVFYGKYHSYAESLIFHCVCSLVLS